MTMVLLVASCGNKTMPLSKDSWPDKSEPGSMTTDSILVFSYKTDFDNPNISNRSDRKIDLLFNGVNNYFGGYPNPKVRFRTECLPCEPIQEYMGALLFAKRLLIMPDQIRFYSNDFAFSDTLDRIKTNRDNRKRINPTFLFSDGKGSIKHIGASCNDADFNMVRLLYPTGEIVIDSLINASFFEYDLNKDGQAEQYLLGSRNCSQELVLLRIRRSNEL